MFPWEHVAFGYLCYSLALRVTGRRPNAGEALVVGFVTLWPDVVDKTLSWVLGWFPQGYSVAHSVFTAAVLTAVVAAAAARLDRPRLGAAFGVGYASHLLGDILYPLVFGDPVVVQKVLWPLVQFESYGEDMAALSRILLYVGDFLEYLVTERPEILVLEAAFMLTALAVWALDGAPVLRELWRALTGPRTDPARPGD